MRCLVTGRVIESMEALGKHLHSDEYKSLISQNSRDIIFIDDSSLEDTQGAAAGAKPHGLIQVAWDMVTNRPSCCTTIALGSSDWLDSNGLFGAGNW